MLTGPGEKRRRASWQDFEDEKRCDDHSAVKNEREKVGRRFGCLFWSVEKERKGREGGEGFLSRRRKLGDVDGGGNTNLGKEAGEELHQAEKCK